MHPGPRRVSRHCCGDLAEVLRDCLGTRLEFPCARCGIAAAAKVAGRRRAVSVKALNSRARAIHPGQHIRPFFARANWRIVRQLMQPLRGSRALRASPEFSVETIPLWKSEI